MTSHLETSRYRELSHFFERIGVGLKKISVTALKKIGPNKKARYRSRNFQYQKRSWNWFQEFWSQKSLSIDIERFGLKTVFVFHIFQDRK